MLLRSTKRPTSIAIAIRRSRLSLAALASRPRHNRQSGAQILPGNTFRFANLLENHPFTDDPHPFDESHFSPQQASRIIKIQRRPLAIPFRPSPPKPLTPSTPLAPRPPFLQDTPVVYKPSKNVRFDFQPGRTVAGKYEIERYLGGGYEGEVYVINERNTGIRRAAKFYYPHRDPSGKAAITYARKLDALRHCPILMQYHHQEVASVKRKKVIVVISELVEGEKLSEFLKRQPEGRLSAFEALHVLHTLAKGIAPIHSRGEYHGDIHDENIMIRRAGIGFEVKLLDFFDLGKPTKSKIRKDVLNLVMVFHSLVGGREHYADQPKVVKDIIRGLKDSLILARFRSAGDLQRHMESLTWDAV